MCSPRAKAWGSGPRSLKNSVQGRTYRLQLTTSNVLSWSSISLWRLSKITLEASSQPYGKGCSKLLLASGNAQETRVREDRTQARPKDSKYGRPTRLVRA